MCQRVVRFLFADNPAITPLDTGNVYFLSPSSAPDGIGGGGFSAESLQRVPPQTDGFVTKPIGVAVSTTEFVITNMKGEVNGAAGQAGGGAVVVRKHLSWDSLSIRLPLVLLLLGLQRVMFPLDTLSVTDLYMM